MEPTELAELILKYLHNTLSEKEGEKLEIWKDQTAGNRRRFEEITEDDHLLAGITIHNQAEVTREMDKSRIDWDAITRQPALVQLNTRSSPRFRLVAAVIFILTVGSASGYFFLQAKTGTALAKDSVHQVKNDVEAPIGSKAILTLSNGARIELDKAQKGIISRQGITDITKSPGGELVYQSVQKEFQTELSYNTLSTAIGGQTRLILGDGTRVWLNSASSITYPPAFTSKDRIVYITGEAYFEVAKDKTKPFIVSSPDMKVRVLGTNFNIHAYPGEDVKTTLLQGSVKILASENGGGSGKDIILQPAQEAWRGRDGKIILGDKVDTDQAIAWLNGKFAFDTENITVIMKQLARWYDLEIVYEGQQPDIQLTASISKKSSLSAVLKVLELSGVHCRLEGKKVIVRY